MAASPRRESPVAERRKSPLSPAVRAVAGLVCLPVIGGVGYFVIYPYALAAYHGRQAERALEARDFPRAKEHLARVLEVRPRSGETQFLLARTCRRSGD